LIVKIDYYNQTSLVHPFAPVDSSHLQLSIGANGCTKCKQFNKKMALPVVTIRRRLLQTDRCHGQSSYSYVDPGELVCPTEDGKEWYNSIKWLKAKSKTTTKSAKRIMTEAESVQPRKGQAKSINSKTDDRSKESESEGGDVEDRAGELQR
jgi:hypothetical protein